MRRLFVYSLFLLLSCEGEQPVQPVRTIEARTTREVAWAPCRPVLKKGHLIADADCGPRHNAASPVSQESEACDAMTSTPEALDQLLTRPHCTNEAVGALERFNAPATDLSAAYYVRAQREDSPSDLLRALDAAERAIATEGHRLEARFNRALILEKLGLADDATQAWDEIRRTDRSDWGTEANQHRINLLNAKTNSATARWNAIKEQLPAIAARGDRPKIARLIRPFPAATYEFVGKNLEMPGIDAVAGEYTRLTGDRYPVDLVANPEVSTYAKLDRVQLSDLTARGYKTLAGRWNAKRAYDLVTTSKYVEGLERYDAARVHFVETNDHERLAQIHTRRGSALRVLGDYDLALRDLFEARRYAADATEPSVHALLYGDTALVALDMGYPAAALMFQNAVVRLANSAHQQSIAHRHRATIHLRLGDRKSAQRDLATAIELYDPEATPADRRALDARLAEVQGQLADNPQRSIAEFTRALDLSATTEYRTFRAHLHLQRADVHTRAGHKAEAASDRIAALNLLGEEEQGLLTARELGDAEQLWRAYFSRFAGLYRRVIQTFIDEGDPDQAFAWAERSRAFEPLNLLLKLEGVPPAFREMAAKVSPKNLERIQAELPVGTFLIEYTVMNDRTYVWIVSRDGFEQQTLPITEKQIEQWTAAIHEAARLRKQLAFQAVLTAAHGLVAEPLKAIARMPHGRDAARRVVLVPDGAIHGLPLAALLDPITKRYVIEDQPVSIAGSATLYAFSLRRDRNIASTAAPSALLIADPLFTQELELTQRMERLPKARTEVGEIAPLYAPAVKVLVDRDATVAGFFELASNSSVVHFAGHAIARPRAPHQSLLLFAFTNTDTGALDAETLLTKLHLDRCRLVVLSACSTAGGSPIGAEGLAPLVRPILAAGAPGVVGTLWNVGDETAASFLVPFHKHYRDGLDADIALQKAQLEFINRNRTSALAWAPFQVIGHASSPFARRASYQEIIP